MSLQVFRHLLGPDWHPLRVELAHDPLGPMADYEAYLGCPVDFRRGR